MSINKDSNGKTRNENGEPILYDSYLRSVGPALQLLRVTKRLSQEQVVRALSELLGDEIKQSYLSKVESKAKTGTPISVRRLFGLLQVLDTSPHDFLDLVSQFAAKDGKNPLQMLESARVQLEQMSSRNRANGTDPSPSTPLGTRRSRPVNRVSMK